MKKTALYGLVFLAALAGRPSFAADETAMPTHCKADEFAYLNAKMGKIAYTPAGEFKVVKNGKILSLCADRRDGKATRLYYRYGAIGKVEMEEVATPQHKFWTYSQSTSPHTGQDLIFFRRGDYTYYVGIATGMGSGISLSVFKSRKEVVSLFSGNDGGDYESELIELPPDLFADKQPEDSPGP